MKELKKYETFELTLKAYRRYLLKCAQRCGVNEHVSDIEQAASIGLYNAWINYEEGKGTFHGYAQFWIKKEMIDYINKSIRTIYIPAHQLVKSHAQYNPDAPTHINTVSTATPIGDEGFTVEDLLGCEDIDKSYDDEVHNQVNLLNKYMAELSDNYRNIVWMRDVEELNFKQIAEQLGMTSQNASLSYGKAVKKLQEKFGIELKKHNNKRIHIK